MNNENKPSVIAELTAALASMAERAALLRQKPSSTRKVQASGTSFHQQGQGTERHAGRTPESP